ncbi:MAG: (2Fe-2S)-binding protein [Bdellovibrionaceae bacterium]|nr:(2Fe-2S)-binding protein [Bdellovibrionales bacterium]MCB9086344.1 (2Fe-2S)-binding protein [Pseudobdellovibrionaceae bacterium]
MATITLARSQFKITSQAKATLMESLLSAGRPVASSCGGEGVCGRCRVQVVSGSENLSAETMVETRRKNELAIPAGERLSCQAYVLGDVSVDAPYW